jgi:hypothetical protein
MLSELNKRENLVNKVMKIIETFLPKTCFLLLSLLVSASG